MNVQRQMHDSLAHHNQTEQEKAALYADNQALRKQVPS
jgi:hypothetical protein